MRQITVNGGTTNSATKNNPGYGLLLAKGGSNDGIVLIDVALNKTYTSFEPGGTFSISVSGATWTFSGNLVNGSNTSEAGAISGTCTCVTP